MPPNSSLAARLIRRAAVEALKAPVIFYRYVVSPWLAANCRFQPTCSAYALTALETHGPARGAALTIRRMARCRPGGGSGYDPVPPKGRPGSGECSHD